MAKAALGFKNNYSLSVENVTRVKKFGDHTVGTYKDSRLIGQVPIKLLFLFCNFIEEINN